MPKIKNISLVNYARKRGWTAQARPLATTTPTGKLASEYFELLKLGVENSHDGILEYLKRVQELKAMQESKLNQQYMAKKFSLETFELLRDAGSGKKHHKDMLYMLTYMNKDVLNDIVRAVGDEDNNVSFGNFWGYILEIIRRAKEDRIYSRVHIKVIFNLTDDLLREALMQIEEMEKLNNT